MKYFCIVALSILTSCGMAKNPSNVSSIYPVRDPFEFVLTTTSGADNSYILNEMTKKCNAPFRITESIEGNGLIVHYFTCKVGEMKYLLLLGLLASCSNVMPKPKYKNGTCLESSAGYTVNIRHVEIVNADYEYVIDIYTIDGFGRNSFSRSHITQSSLELNEFKVVQCPKGEI